MRSAIILLGWWIIYTQGHSQNRLSRQDSRSFLIRVPLFSWHVFAKICAAKSKQNKNKTKQQQKQKQQKPKKNKNKNKNKNKIKTKQNKTKQKQTYIQTKQKLIKPQNPPFSLLYLNLPPFLLLFAFSLCPSLVFFFLFFFILFWFTLFCLFLLFLLLFPLFLCMRATYLSVQIGYTLTLHQ